MASNYFLISLLKRTSPHRASLPAASQKGQVLIINSFYAQTDGFFLSKCEIIRFYMKRSWINIRFTKLPQ